MPRRLELRPHVGVVVDLAVVDDPHGLVFIGQRLLARRQIDDAEPAVREARVVVVEDAGFVRAAMREDVAHGDEARALVGVEPIGGDDPCDAAHD